MIFNPWGEAKRLRARVFELESQLTVQRTLNALMRLKLTNTHRRDPKTGRMLPKGK